MEKIISTTNSTIKEYSKLQQKKYRDESKLFLAEGDKTVRGFYSEGFEFVALYIKDDSKNTYDYIDTKKYIASEAVISKISTTKSPCSVVGIVKQKLYSIDNFLNKNKLVMLENIKDAGNMGTIIRSCKAFGIEGIVLLGDTIDLYNPKVVRATVGCAGLPVINADYEDISKFKKFTIYSTALYENSIPLKQVEFKEPYIIAFGSEAEGLSKDFLKNETTNIKIEMAKNVESLNLASAVSICLYEMYACVK